MANYATITNTQFDAAAAAVPAPFGPVTRQENVGTATPNSHLPVLVRSAAPFSRDFRISYSDLLDVERRNRVFFNAHEADNVIHLMLGSIVRAAAAVHLTNNFAPMTDANFQRFIRTLRFLNNLFGVVPIEAWKEVDADETVRIGSPTGNTALAYSLSIPVTGAADYVVVDFGVPAATPHNPTGRVFNLSAGGVATATNTYAAAGTYQVTIIAVGAGGVDFRRVSATVS